MTHNNFILSKHLNTFTLNRDFKMSYIFVHSKLRAYNWHFKRHHINFTGLQTGLMRLSSKPNKTNYCLKQKPISDYELFFQHCISCIVKHMAKQPGIGGICLFLICDSKI